ncbi:hypothetical protein [Melissospora conviva]|uniref:hypothetical protein n=1 Tax=Melissospora conviva TaxID=3388432 RepID=UPI003C2027C4
MTVTASKTDQHGTVTCTTDTYTIRIQPRFYYEPMPTAAYVDDNLAASTDPELARLAADEAALGGRRYAQRGEHPEVDALYARLNERIASVKLRLAREIVPLLAGVVDGDLSVGAIDTLYFSKHAGCDMCLCSPGVVVPGSLTLGGARADIWITPKG